MRVRITQKRQICFRRKLRNTNTACEPGCCIVHSEPDILARLEIQNCVALIGSHRIVGGMVEGSIRTMWLQRRLATDIDRQNCDLLMAMLVGTGPAETRGGRKYPVGTIRLKRNHRLAANAVSRRRLKRADRYQTVLRADLGEVRHIGVGLSANAIELAAQFEPEGRIIRIVRGHGRCALHQPG